MLARLLIVLVGVPILSGCGVSRLPDMDTDSRPEDGSVKDVGRAASAFREAFNAGRGRLRFVAILSPT